VEEIDGAIQRTVSSLIGRPPKDENDMTDPESAGRKRAAALLPKDELINMICEWSMLKEAGGGVFPIKGCQNNKATDRHHGPNKNTLDNERGTNIPAICALCHNSCHAAKDATYVGERPKDSTPWVPNQPYKAHNSEDKMTLKESLVEELKRQ
jgi:hypothetical protein